MNNKGFTLIELLATLVIISIVGGIATFSVTSYISTSKDTSEKVFVDELSQAIDAYIDLYGTKLVSMRTCSGLSFTKTGYSTKTTITQLGKSSSTNVYFSDLVDAGILDESEVVNPKNGENCLSGKDPYIKIYKDSDYVYYYYVNLSGSKTSCDISSDNGIINTFPNETVRGKVSSNASC